MRLPGEIFDDEIAQVLKIQQGVQVLELTSIHGDRERFAATEQEPLKYPATPNQQAIDLFSVQRRSLVSGRSVFTHELAQFVLQGKFLYVDLDEVLVQTNPLLVSEAERVLFLPMP